MDSGAAGQDALYAHHSAGRPSDWKLCVRAIAPLRPARKKPQPALIEISVTVVTQEEVDLHCGVYERMLAEKHGVVPPIQ